MSQRDRLYLLDPEFADPALPGKVFYCKDCATVEGLLAAFPERAATLDVVRVAFPRPRTPVIEAIGEGNQNLPCLVLAEGGFVNEIEALLAVLHTRHGFPERHP
ncbi:DUF3088 family protein [Sphingomonas sp.]|uniref:DUF3088 family protein n=1 Tax=Sphingomonas sp. TaxID=28214 RepID=UPI002EDAF38F